MLIVFQSAKILTFALICNNYFKKIGTITIFYTQDDCNSSGMSSVLKFLFVILSGESGVGLRVFL
jgi:hypothetical protein